MDEAGHYPGILVSAADDDAAVERAFEAAVRETADLAVRVAYSVLRQREDAEEVAQEAFARAYPRFRRLSAPDRFRGWIVRVSWRLAIDRWRADRRRTRREQTSAPAGSAADVETLALEAQRSARLWEAIDALPEKLRVVVVLSALQEHDMKEVARLLGIPEGTVKSRLFLARKALARRLSCLAGDTGTR
jgi:RNA polymerase sigma-70 factor (ECF subfamily)